MRAPTIIASLLACAIASTTHAQNEEKPLVATVFEAHKGYVQNDGDNAYFLLTENVVVIATNMRLECDKLEVFASRTAEDPSDIGQFGAIKEIIATGNVRIEQAERTATCQKAIVQPNQERIVLTGNPVVEQPGGRLVTFNPEDEIILNRGNGKISINTKGPRKLRLTSTAIKDLGFEQDLPVPTPKPEGEPETKPKSKKAGDEKIEAPDSVEEKSIKPTQKDEASEPKAGAKKKTVKRKENKKDVRS